MTARRPEPIELDREHAVRVGTFTDLAMLVANLTLGLLVGSLTILAEAIRGGLMLSVEAYALVVLHRMHRGRVASAEYGNGKLEVFCNLLIALAKIGASIWIASKAMVIVQAGQSEASPLGMALAASLGAVGLFVNLRAFRLVHGVTARARSAIMTSQLISRTVKLRCAFVIFVTLTIGATTEDPVIAAWADALGALAVAWFILIAAIRTIRVCLIDLLDLSVDDATRRAIERALARHRSLFADLRRMRSRRSGTTVFIEVALGFDPMLPLAEIDRRVSELRASLTAEVAGADVAIIPLPHDVAPQA